MGGNLRCTFIFIGQKEALKVHGSIDGVDFVAEGLGNKINGPDVIGIFHTGMNHRVYSVVNIGHKFVVIIPGHSAKAEFYILKMQNIF